VPLLIFDFLKFWYSSIFRLIVGRIEHGELILFISSSRFVSLLRSIEEIIKSSPQKLGFQIKCLFFM